MLDWLLLTFTSGLLGPGLNHKRWVSVPFHLTIFTRQQITASSSERKCQLRLGHTIIVISARGNLATPIA